MTYTGYHSTVYSLKQIQPDYQSLFSEVNKELMEKIFCQFNLPKNMVVEWTDSESGQDLSLIPADGGR